jgi:hypothetical protein
VFAPCETLVSGLIFGGNFGASLGGVNDEVESLKPYPQLIDLAKKSRRGQTLQLICM